MHTDKKRKGNVSLVTSLITNIVFRLSATHGTHQDPTRYSGGVGFTLIVFGGSQLSRWALIPSGRVRVDPTFERNILNIFFFEKGLYVWILINVCDNFYAKKDQSGIREIIVDYFSRIPLKYRLIFFHFVFGFYYFGFWFFSKSVGSGFGFTIFFLCLTLSYEC